MLRENFLSSKKEWSTGESKEYILVEIYYSFCFYSPNLIIWSYSHFLAYSLLSIIQTNMPDIYFPSLPCN